jgi:hypothetical protein
MKKMLVALLVAGVCSFAGVATARADDNTVVVKVPFQFIVGDKVLPAGEYRIAPPGSDPSLLMITRIDGKGGAMVITESTGVPAPEGPKVNVTFKNFAGNCFLWQVGLPGRDTREVTLSKQSAERVLARLNLMPAQPAKSAK